MTGKKLTRSALRIRASDERERERHVGVMLLYVDGTSMDTVADKGFKNNRQFGRNLS